MHKRPHIKQAQSEVADNAPKSFQTQVEAPYSPFIEFERLRFPRSLEEAFGPYARGPLYAPKEKMPIADKVLIVAGVVAVVGMVAFIAFSY